MSSGRRERVSPAHAMAGFALIAALAAALWACSPRASGKTDAEIVVAEVDNVPIVLRDVKNEILSMRGYAPSLEARGPGNGEVSEALRRLIDRSIVLREGERRGVNLPAGALEEEVMRFRSDFPPGGLEKALLQAGMEPDAWRDQLRRSLLYRRSAEAIAASAATVTPQEVESAFRKGKRSGTLPERIRVRQYLFDSTERAAAAREKLVSGGVPEGDRGDSSAEGVDLGLFSREEIPPGFPDGLFDLPEGGVAGPVSGEGGASLFQVTRREAARAQTLRTEEEGIRESILGPRRDAAFHRWLSQATAGARLKVRAELLDQLTGEKR